MMTFEEMGLITATDAMKRLGISRQGFYNKINSGTIPHPKLDLGWVTLWPIDIIEEVKSLLKENAMHKSKPMAKKPGKPAKVKLVVSKTKKAKKK